MIHGDYAGYAAESGIDSVTQYELWKAIWSGLNDGNFHELDWALVRHNEFLDDFVVLPDGAVLVAGDDSPGFVATAQARHGGADVAADEGPGLRKSSDEWVDPGTKSLISALVDMTSLLALPDMRVLSNASHLLSRRSLLQSSHLRPPFALD